MAGSWDVGPGSDPGSWDAPAPTPPPAQGATATPAPGPGRASRPGPASGPGVSHAPIGWLLGGLAAAALGLLVPLVTHGLGPALVGWVLGGLVAIGLLGVFLSRDLQRRARGLAADSEVADWLRRLLVGLAVVAVALNAWHIADALARREW